MFSTIEVNGIRTTLGRPVPAAERTKDWALVDMLATEPEYYGKLRVIIYNLRRGVDAEAAYRNAVAKTPAEIAKLADQFLAGWPFPDRRSLGAAHERARFPREAGGARAPRAWPWPICCCRLVSQPAYEKMIEEKVNVAEAWEGLGLLALHAGQKDAARADFAKVDGSRFAKRRRLHRIRPPGARSKPRRCAALEKAVKVNPKLAEPYVLMAEREADLDKRIVDLAGRRQARCAPCRLVAGARRRLSHRAQLRRSLQGLARGRAGCHRRPRIATATGRRAWRSSSSAWITKPPSAAARKRRNSARSSA